MKFLKQLKNTLKEYNMLKAQDKVLVCVSGGPDSISLLYALHSVKDELGISLYVAHLNHMLRSHAAKLDEAFVKRCAGNLGIPIFVDKKDVARLSKKDKSSIEDKARQVRYSFFSKIARSNGLNKIALAHTRDDQAETVLMRLIKGAGPRGLRGIPPKRKLEAAVIIRPLIEVSKDEILEFLNKRRIPYRIDRSNLQNKYLRNRIRNLLLPGIQKEFNPNIKGILNNISSELSKAYDFLHDKSEQIFKKVSRSRGISDELIIFLDKLSRYHDAIKSEVVRIAIENKKGDLNRITHKNWKDLESLMSSNKSGAQVHIPGGITVIKDYNTLVFAKKGVKNITNKRKWKLEFPGKTQIDKLGICFETKILKKPPRSLKNKGKNVEYFSYDNLKAPLYIRTRLIADRFRPIGMSREVKLQNFLVNEKVSRHRRDTLPLMISNGKIVWVVGHRISDLAKVTPKAGKILRIECNFLHTS